MRAFTSKTVGIFQLPMHSGQNEPQTGVQAGDILRIMDELHAWTDFMCFPSVRCIRTKRSGSGKARSPRGKEYSNKVRLEVELLSSHFLMYNISAPIRRKTPFGRRAPAPVCYPSRQQAPSRNPRTLLPPLHSHPGPSGSPTYLHYTCPCLQTLERSCVRFLRTMEPGRVHASGSTRMHLMFSGSRRLEICLQTIGRRFRQAIPWPGPRKLGMLNLLAPLTPRIRSLVIHEQWIPSYTQCRFLEGSLP